MRAVWPERRHVALAAAVLFLVYPAYRIQPVAAVVGNIVLQLSFVLASLAASLWALRVRRRFLPLAALGLILAVAGLLFGEYFIGLEAVRLLLMAVVLRDASQRSSAAIRKALVHWLPYGAVTALYLAWWMIAARPAEGASINHARVLGTVADAPLYFLKQQVLFQMQDILTVTLTGWREALSLNVFSYHEDSLGPFLVFWIVAALVTTVVCIVLSKVRAAEEDTAHEHSRFVWSIGVMGVCVTAAGLFAVWAGMLHIGDETRDIFLDRLLLPAMPGAALAGYFLVRAVAGRKRFIVILSLLAGLSAAAQYRHERVFADDWQEQGTFFWQLAWRAPALSSETTFVIGDHGEDYWPSRHYEVSAPMNLVYATPSEPMRWAATGYLARDFSIVPDSSETMLVHQYLLSHEFRDTTTGFVPLALRRDGSFRILDRETFLRPPNNLQRFVARANVNDLVASGGVTARRAVLERYFGPEPPHEWDYHYQKADLARSHGEWRTVVAHMDSATAGKLTPRDPLEWLVFLEGCIRASAWERARGVVERIAEDGRAPDAIRADRYVRRLAARADMGEPARAHLDELSDLLREARAGVVSPNPGWGHRIIRIDTAAVR